ncbi:hypothetical protein [Burkholderia glumae]|uniref:hypothetical protein n=1 Tax=Burkholderia glumae TaxID=337 RepID=UPI0030B93E38
MNAVITEIPALAHDAGVPPAPPEAHQQADDVRLIPLKRIVASPFNMRRKQPIGIEALADNIWHTGGLLQNLVVHPMKVGAKRAQTYGVAAGEPAAAHLPCWPSAATFLTITRSAASSCRSRMPS